MTLDNVKAGTSVIADTIPGEDPKLFPAVINLVQNMPGGVSGLVKQFQDKGLRNVAASLMGRGATRPISPQQIVHGLGTDTMRRLATASGLDVKVVRKELVAILPKVMQQLDPAEKAVEAMATA